MMKKYFLIGKEYLNKKLQELDIQTSNVDYVQEQIPSRLRAPLNVLKNPEIDIEDSHQYETYFKNYPNHHLSHFLLQKYLMLQEAHSDPPEYLPPHNQNTFVPPFDKQLQKKALLLKEAIQQYDQGFSKTDQPLLCISVIHFHHKRGTQVEYRFPKTKIVEGIENMIVHHAMPDSSHNKHEDYNFFNFEAQLHGKRKMLFGVSYFKQIKLTQQMKKDNSELTRSYLQKAVAIVSTLPLFGYLKMRLSITTKLFFQQFTNFQIIDLAFKDINNHLIQTWPQMQLTDFYIGSDLKVIINLFGAAQFYEIWKAILYQKRVVVFAHSSSSASSFILSLISLFPGLNTFGIFSKPISKYMQALRQYALPLRLFSSNNFLFMSFHIQDFYLLNKFVNSEDGSFLLGTTNRLLKQTNNNYGIELIVNLQNCTVQKRKTRRAWQPLSKKQKTFVNQLTEIVGQQKNFGYGGSEDCIRNHFHSFLKGALVEMADSIKLFRKFIQDCDQYSNKSNQKKQSQNKSKSQSMKQSSEANYSQKNEDKNGFPPLLPNQISQMVLPELLLNKSFAYFLQFHNEKLPQIVKGQLFPSLYIDNYDYFLRINKEQFISYNWLDKKLVFGTGSNKSNYEGKQIKFAKVVQSSFLDFEEKDEAKSIYIGNVHSGKFHKNGFYIDQYEHYEGEFYKGRKEGYGKYTTKNQKYIGNFKNNLYEGDGQLIIGGDIYVGQFKQGLKNGYGSSQGSFVFEGEWQNDKPIKQNKNQKQVQNQNSVQKPETQKIQNAQPQIQKQLPQKSEEMGQAQN